MLRHAALLLIIAASGCGGSADAPVFVGNAAADSAPSKSPADAVNINTATAEELQRLPHIGEKKAAAIIEYRERRGGFHRVEELMLVDGISDKRFRALRPLITVE